MSWNEFKEETKNEKENSYLFYKDENGKLHNMILLKHEYYVSTLQGHIKISQYNAFMLLQHIKNGWFKAVQMGLLGEQYNLNSEVA